MRRSLPADWKNAQAVVARGKRMDGQEPGPSSLPRYADSDVPIEGNKKNNQLLCHPLQTATSAETFFTEERNRHINVRRCPT